MSGPLRRVRENVTPVVSMLVTGVWLAALVTGQSWWLAAMLVGYVVVVPITALLSGDRESIEEWWDDEDISMPDESDESAGSDASDDPIRTLRDRYARGELTDEEFERRLERLLETESIGDADGEPDRVDSIDRELERERS